MPDHLLYETCIYCGRVRNVDHMRRVTGSYGGDLRGEASTWMCERLIMPNYGESESVFQARQIVFNQRHQAPPG